MQEYCCAVPIEPIDGGDLYIGDRRVNDVPPAQRDIAMVHEPEPRL